MRVIQASQRDSDVTSAVTTACNRLAAQASALALVTWLVTRPLVTGTNCHASGEQHPRS